MAETETGPEPVLAAWAETLAGYPLAPERLPLIAADLRRFSAALAAAGAPPFEVEPVTDFRQRLVAGADS